METKNKGDLMKLRFILRSYRDEKDGVVRSGVEKVLQVYEHIGSGFTGKNQIPIEKYQWCDVPVVIEGDLSPSTGDCTNSIGERKHAD